MNQARSEQLARQLAAIADSKKAEDVVVLDMRELVSYTDFLAICTARNGSPPESGSTTARITAANEESGPRTRMRLGPKSAYASNGIVVA